MPIIYVCKKCNTVLHVTRASNDNFGIMTFSEFIARVTSKCPNCGRPLEKPSPSDIAIIPTNGDNKMRSIILILVRRMLSGDREKIEELCRATQVGRINGSINTKNLFNQLRSIAGSISELRQILTRTCSKILEIKSITDGTRCTICNKIVVDPQTPSNFISTIFVNHIFYNHKDLLDNIVDSILASLTRKN